VILSGDARQIESEDSLFAVLISLGSDFSHLLGPVRFEYSSRNGIDSFISAISSSSLDSRLWSSICRRLRHGIVLEASDELTVRSKIREICCTFQPSFSPWSGVLLFLTAKRGGNVRKRGIVNITSSPDGCNKSCQAANHGRNHEWYTTNSARSWIEFDFKDS
jgi:hypothetical protein